MSVRSGQSVTTDFTTRAFATGAATDADSTPTGVLVVNGTDNGATVTVTKIATGLLDADPGFPGDDIPERAWSDAEPFGEGFALAVAEACCCQTTNLADSFFGQLGVNIAFPQAFGGWRPSAFGVHVRRVDRVVAEKKVGRVATGAVVAAMTDVDGPWKMVAELQFLGNAMGVQDRSSAQAKDTVATATGGSLPFPALVRRKNLNPLPEVFDPRLRVSKLRHCSLHCVNTQYKATARRIPCR